MIHRMGLAAVALAMLGACNDTGTPNNSDGIAALDSNNSAFRGGAAPTNVGNAATNGATGVTGGNGNTVSRMNGNSGGKGGGPQTSGPAPAAPGSR